MQRKPSRATTKSTLFTFSKNYEWNTKEDTGISKTKGTSRAEATLNSEKIESITLSIVELRKSEGIRLLVN